MISSFRGFLNFSTRHRESTSNSPGCFLLFIISNMPTIPRFNAFPISFLARFFRFSVKILTVSVSLWYTIFYQTYQCSFFSPRKTGPPKTFFLIFSNYIRRPVQFHRFSDSLFFSLSSSRQCSKIVVNTFFLKTINLFCLVSVMFHIYVLLPVE